MGHVPLNVGSCVKPHVLRARWEILDEIADNGQSIQERTRGCGADLLVIGAWGHSRVSEWWRGIIKHYMRQLGELPLLAVEA
jgi:hypothetical protein